MAGEGQLVQIVGEPGIGKSRLLEEFRGKLAETPHTWVEWAASQLLQNTPLHPLAEWGRLRYGGADASDGQKLADLENTLRLIGLDAAEYAPLLAPLFDVALPEDRAAKFAPEELRRRQLAAMTALFLAGARSQPVVLAFEDLHWGGDPGAARYIRDLCRPPPSRSASARSSGAAGLLRAGRPAGHSGRASDCPGDRLQAAPPDFRDRRGRLCPRFQAAVGGEAPQRKGPQVRTAAALTLKAGEPRDRRARREFFTSLLIHFGTV